MKVIQKGSKKIVSIVLSLMMIFGGLTLSTSNVSANDTPSNYFTTSDNGDGTVTITDYSNDGPKDVVIPNTIDNKQVTAIGDSAFELKQLTSVIIPSSIEKIGAAAFESQQNYNGEPTLDKVVILGKTTKIGDDYYDVFKDSTTNSFKMYGYWQSTAQTYAAAVGTNKPTPYDFFALEYWVTIDFIEDQEWTGSAITPTVVVKDRDDTNKVLTENVDYTVLYENNIDLGIAKAKITGKGDYEYATVTRIFNIVKKYGDYTYEVNEDGTTVTITGYSKNGPKKVVIPNEIDGKPVTAIGKSAFEQKDLTSVIIPKSVTTIGAMAFFINWLENVVIPNGVTTIGNGAFAGNELAHVTLPNSVITIGDGAFATNELEDVAIPESVTTIGEGAFGTNKLISITIPDSVVNIGRHAFSSNKSYGLPISEIKPCLEKVIILGKNTVIGDNTFYDVFIDSISSDFKMYGYANSTAETYAQISKINPDMFIDKAAYTFIAFDNWLTVDNINEQVWTGSAVEPKLVVKDKYDANKLLTKDKDYTVTYKNNIDAGTATVTITGIGDYEYATATKDFTIIKYTFTEGTEQSITIGNDKDLTFKVDGPLNLLDKVYINDEELDAANYTTASGSTIITLKKEYVSTLTTGTYTLKATYTNGVIASTAFEIKAKETTSTNPTTTNSTNLNTGDNSNVTLWTSLLSLSGLIGLGYVVLSKKRKMN